MLRNAVRLLTLALLLAPAAARAQETYEFKFKKDAAGMKAVYENQEEVRTRMKLTDDNQNALKEDDNTKKKTIIYRETILELPKGEKRPTKFKREYRKAQETEKGETKTLGLEGKTIVFEKILGRYEFSLVGGGELPEEERKKLDEQLNRPDRGDLEKALMPGKAVKVGEEWKIDAGVLAKAMQLDGKMQMHREQTRAVGKLVKVHKKGRAQFGVIELTVEMVPAAITEGGLKIEFRPGSKMKMVLTADVCIDGTLAAGDMRMTMAFDGAATVPLPDGTNLTMNLTLAGTMGGRVVEE